MQPEAAEAFVRSSTKVSVVSGLGTSFFAPARSYPCTAMQSRLTRSSLCPHTARHSHRLQLFSVWRRLRVWFRWLTSVCKQAGLGSTTGICRLRSFRTHSCVTQLHSHVCLHAVGAAQPVRTCVQPSDRCGKTVTKWIWARLIRSQTCGPSFWPRPGQWFLK